MFLPAHPKSYRQIQPIEACKPARLDHAVVITRKQIALQTTPTRSHPS